MCVELIFANLTRATYGIFDLSFTTSLLLVERIYAQLTALFTTLTTRPLASVVWSKITTIIILLLKRLLTSLPHVSLGHSWLLSSSLVPPLRPYGNLTTLPSILTFALPCLPLQLNKKHYAILTLCSVSMEKQLFPSVFLLFNTTTLNTIDSFMHSTGTTCASKLTFSFRS